MMISKNSVDVNCRVYLKSIFVFSAMLLFVGACSCASKPGGEEKVVDPKVQPDAKPVVPAVALPAKTTKSKGPTRFQKTVKKFKDGVISSSPVKIDGMETLKGWFIGDWDDFGIIKSFKDARCGRKVVYLATGGGKKGKCTMAVELKAKTPSAGKFSVALYNNSKVAVKVALGFRIGARRTYFESKARKIPVGKWVVADFDSNVAEYKSQASKWKHNQKLPADSTIGQLSVLMYHGGKLSRILIDGLSVQVVPVKQ
jgi:hypothetical protein